MSRKTTRQLVPLKQAAGDLVDEDYGILCPAGDEQPAGFRCCVFLLSLFHILLALASIALGLAAVCTNVSGYYIGYGVWCGCIFLLTGIITWITICQPCMTNGMITTSMVFNIIAACAAAVQFSLAIVATTNDRFDTNGRLTDRRLIRVGRYDVYYSKMSEWFPCSATYNWSSWSSVDILLIIVASVEAFVAIFAAALACRSICSGRLNTAPVYDDTPANLIQIQTDYPADGYGVSNIGYVGPATGQVMYIR